MSSPRAPRAVRRVRVALSALAGLGALAYVLVACGGLLGVDFGDARPYGDGGAGGPGSGDGVGPGSPGGGDLGVAGSCAPSAPCGDAGCPSSSGNIVAIRGDDNRVCALYRDHSVKCWAGLADTPSTVAEPALGIVKLTGGEFLIGLDAQGKAYGIGYANTDAGSSPLELDFPVADIAAGEGAYCMLTTSCAVKCMGANANGELGNDSTLDSVHPVDVVGIEAGATKVAAGYDDACALLADGTVKCWGSNYEGERGGSSTKDSLVPEDLLVQDVADIVTGDWHTCLLTNAGQIACFGGWGTTGGGSYVAPIESPGVVVQMVVGSTHGCLVTSAGGAKCWGESNAYGELGNGDKPPPPPAVTGGSLDAADVVGLTSGVAAVAVSRYQSCALLTSGGVKCWGAATQGDYDAGSAVPEDMPGL